MVNSQSSSRSARGRSSISAMSDRNSRGIPNSLVRKMKSSSSGHSTCTQQWGANSSSSGRMEWSLSTHHTAPTIKVGRSVRQDDGAGGAYTALIRREGIVHRSILFLICCLLLKHLAAGNICYHLLMPCKGTKKPPPSTTTYLYSPILCLIHLTDNPKALAEEYPS